MNKKVFLNNQQHIEMIFNEKLEEEELREVLRIATILIRDNIDKNIPVKLLANVNKLNNLTIGARRYGSSWLLKQPITKIAVFGDNLFMKYFIRMLTRGLGISDKMKYFVTKKEAQTWLNNL